VVVVVDGVGVIRVGRDQVVVGDVDARGEIDRGLGAGRGSGAATLRAERLEREVRGDAQPKYVDYRLFVVGALEVVRVVAELARDAGGAAPGFPCGCRRLRPLRGP
jgi:hypothetical protein